MVPPRGCPHAVRWACKPRPKFKENGDGGLMQAGGARQSAACWRMPRCRCWRNRYSAPVPGCRFPPLLPLGTSNNTRPASWAAKCCSALPAAFLLPGPGCRKRGRSPRRVFDLRLAAKRVRRGGRLNVARRRLSPSESQVPAVLAVAFLVPGPCSRRSLAREIFHNLNVSRIFAETLTSTGTFKKRACFDQK